MASFFPNGTIFSLSGAPGPAEPVSSISNANPAVATSVGHALSTGDIVLLSAASTALEGRVARVGSITADTFSLLNINTSSTTDFPPGFGVGYAYEMGGFTPLSQVRNITTSGGEQQYATWKYVDDRKGNERRRKTHKAARGLEITLDFDPTLPWHAALLAADDDQTTRVLRADLPIGHVFLYSVEVAYSGEPTYDMDQNMQVRVGFSLVSPESTLYLAA